MEIVNRIMDAFDPLINLIQGLAYPVAFIMLVLGCLLLMLGQKHKGINVLKWAVIGYIAIQFIPGIMQILVEVGDAMKVTKE